MRDLHIDITAICGLIGPCAIGMVAIMHGDRETIAAGAVGAIGGWLTRRLAGETPPPRKAARP